MDRNLILYRITPIVISLVIMLSMTTFFLSEGGFAQSLRDRMGWIIYDLRMSAALNNQSPDPAQLPVTIVDIDEASLAKLGHWPWQRDTLTELTRKLIEQGAVVVAFDVLFAEEQDQAKKMIAQYQTQLDDHTQNAFFDDIQEALDGDKRFAQMVANNEVVLSIVFNNGSFTKGNLSKPLVYHAKDTEFFNNMPAAHGYISSTERLSEAANYIGFINAHPDADGIMRRARLVQLHDGKLYPSLALASTMGFLLAEQAQLHSDIIGEKRYLSGVQVFDQLIPVDSNGDLLIPYQGPAYTFPYISAMDVLEDKADAKSIEGKVILIGATAASLSDFRATPTNSLFPGVEAHANVITGILNNQFYDQPEWTHGINFILIVVGGALLSLLLPFLSPLLQLSCMAVFLGGIIGFDYWLWINQHFIIDSVVPILTVLLIGAFNMAYGFIINSRDRLQLKAMFGQYVPPQLVDEMSKKPGEFAMEGQRKEMSVLFADIRNFTSISEGLSAAQLKHWLNTYFTPITEIIFHTNGTIDKYVGDMVMAFWGAPLTDADHALHSVQAAQQMLTKTQQLKQQFIDEGRPAVEIGIGISSGHMNVGNMGSQYRRSYTVIGDKVNLGSRLEGLTKYYGVDLIVSEQTRTLIGERMAFRHLDRVRVKGKAQPVDIFEPITAAQQSECARYHHALQQYLMGDFAAAEIEFLALQERSSSTLYELYLQRCRELKQKTPADWQGVYTHTEK